MLCSSCSIKFVWESWWKVWLNRRNEEKEAQEAHVSFNFKKLDTLNNFTPIKPIWWIILLTCTCKLKQLCSLKHWKITTNSHHDKTKFVSSIQSLMAFRLWKWAWDIISLIANRFCFGSWGFTKFGIFFHNKKFQPFLLLHSQHICFVSSLKEGRQDKLKIKTQTRLVLNRDA